MTRVRDLWTYLRLFLRLVAIQLRSSMEYRADFLISVGGAALQQVVSLVLLAVLFRQVPMLGGWNVWNVVLLQGLVATSVGLGELAGNGAWRLRVDVGSGDFDRILVRPVPAALAQLATNAAVHGFGNASVGVLLVAVGLDRSDAWHWWTIPFLAATILCGFVITVAINLMANLPVFWEPSADSSFPTFIARLRDFARFPASIYPGLTQVFVMLLPYSFVSYFPTLLLLDRGPLRWLGLATPLVAAATVALAAIAWRKALDRYQGAGQ